MIFSSTQFKSIFSSITRFSRGNLFERDNCGGKQYFFTIPNTRTHTLLYKDEIMIIFSCPFTRFSRVGNEHLIKNVGKYLRKMRIILSPCEKSKQNRDNYLLFLMIKSLSLRRIQPYCDSLWAGGKVELDHRKHWVHHTEVYFICDSFHMGQNL